MKGTSTAITIILTTGVIITAAGTWLFWSQSGNSNTSGSTAPSPPNQPVVIITESLPEEPQPKTPPATSKPRPVDHSAQSDFNATPDPFDPERWRQDPSWRASYLGHAQACRARQSRPFGKDVPRLQAANGMTEIIAVGQTDIPIRLKGSPDAPVSLSITDMGLFVENMEPAITVVCDSQGIATATYRRTPGVSNLVSIACGSPLCSDNPTLTIHLDRDPSKPIIE